MFIDATKDNGRETKWKVRDETVPGNARASLTERIELAKKKNEQIIVSLIGSINYNRCFPFSDAGRYECRFVFVARRNVKRDKERRIRADSCCR